MHITANTLRILGWFFMANLLAAPAIVPVFVLAEERPIRHEIRAGLSWMRENSTYSHYVSNGELNPSKSESFEKTPLSMTGQYTFFFTPLLAHPDVPARLWYFYRRPSKASLSFTCQPEAQMTNIHEDPALGYYRQTLIDEQARTFTVSGEHYILPDTGISVHYAEYWNDDSSHTQIGADDAGSQRRGENEGMRHQYGIEFSQYIHQNLNVRTGYERLEGEYHYRGRSWRNDAPNFETRSYADSTLTGHHLSGEGVWMTNDFLGLQVRYSYQNYRLKAYYLSVFPKVIPGDSILNYDDLQQHAGTLQFNVYPTRKTSLWWRTTYMHERIQRTYDDIAQIVDFDRRYIQFQTGVEYDVRQAVGLHVRYDYVRRYGDVSIGEDDAPMSLATYDTEQQRHTITIGFVARL